VIVVAKRSSLSRLEAGEDDASIRRLIRDGHEAVRKWAPSHEQHVRTLDAVVEALDALGAKALLLHGSHAEFSTERADLVVTVGGDGTLLAASHWVGDLPVLGVNSAPRFSVGFFCGATARTARRMLAEALEGSLGSVELARMKVEVAGQVRSERVLNEALFCHAEPAATSSYILRVGQRREEQRSSGLWVGPPAGSTGAQRSAGGRVLPLTARQLQLVVRELYSGDGRSYRLVREVVGPRAQIRLVSKMHSARLFLDGPFRVVPVALGDEVRFSVSEQSLRVLGLSASRRR
jgi:NAD+ kinase